MTGRDLLKFLAVVGLLLFVVVCVIAVNDYNSRQDDLGRELDRANCESFDIC